MTWVVLLSSAVVRGRLYGPGSRIDLTAKEARRMVKDGKAERMKTGSGRRAKKS